MTNQTTTETYWIFKYTNKEGFYQDQSNSGSRNYIEPRTTDIEYATKYSEYTIGDHAIWVRKKKEPMKPIQIKETRTYQQEELGEEALGYIATEELKQASRAEKNAIQRREQERKEYERLQKLFEEEGE